MWAGGLLFCLNAAEISSAKMQKTLRMGEKTAHVLCQREALKSLDFDRMPSHTKELLRKKKICHDIGERHLDALVTYLYHTHTKKNDLSHFFNPIPRTRKCPVCGMYPYKYPVWISMISIGKTRYYFDGVKDMMKYYLFKERYRYDRAHIEHIAVRDFYRLVPVDAREAWYVEGSDVRGPMGKELVPFASRHDAETFLKDHHGKRIVGFSQISTDMLIER